MTFTQLSPLCLRARVALTATLASSVWRVPRLLPSPALRALAVALASPCTARTSLSDRCQCTMERAQDGQPTPDSNRELSSKQRGKQRVAPQEDGADDETQAAVQESQWCAGVNRQSLPAAHKHQLAASQAAAAGVVAAKCENTDVCNSWRPFLALERSSEKAFKNAKHGSQLLRSSS